MDKEALISQLQQFREELYQLLPARRDALLDLLDALSSSPHAPSVVALSLSPLFRREYTSINDGIDNLFQASSPEQAAAERQAWQQQVAQLVGRYVPAPQQQSFWLLGTDVVPVPRPFARTLADRTMVYQPNLIRGNKPVTIGHQYSVTAHLPEKQAADPPWVVPLTVRRIQSTEKATVVGAEQLTALLEDETQPWHAELCVHVADSTYGVGPFLGRVGQHRNLVNVVRVAANRVFYRQFVPPPETPRQSGHPRWYGTRFDLQDEATWGPPDETAELAFTTKGGRECRVQLQGWYNLLMRGKRGLPMHHLPFTLIRAVVVDQHGQPVFKRPLWLIVLGERRAELTLVDAWTAYGQRFDLEHYFRFGKQRLLLAAFQTPEVEHEENWLQLVQLATVQLWLARQLVEIQLYPWERYLPPRDSTVAAPSQVQRGWARLFSRIGTPAQPPKRRGNPPGRAKGSSPGRRQRQPVIKKGSQKRQKSRAST